MPPTKEGAYRPYLPIYIGADAGGRPQLRLCVGVPRSVLGARHDGATQGGGVHDNGVDRPRESVCTARAGQYSLHLCVPFHPAG